MNSNHEKGSMPWFAEKTMREGLWNKAEGVWMSEYGDRNREQRVRAMNMERRTRKVRRMLYHIWDDYNGDIGTILWLVVALMVGAGIWFVYGSWLR